MGSNVRMKMPKKRIESNFNLENGRFFSIFIGWDFHTNDANNDGDQHELYKEIAVDEFVYHLSFLRRIGQIPFSVFFFLKSSPKSLLLNDVL